METTLLFSTYIMIKNGKCFRGRLFKWEWFKDINCFGEEKKALNVKGIKETNVSFASSYIKQRNTEDCFIC